MRNPGLANRSTQSDTSTDEPIDPPQLESALWLWLILFACAVLGGWLAWHNADTISNDGVAYLMVARHYAAGDLGLAFNGYWGPALSWLLVPALWLGIDPLCAARAILLAAGLLVIVATWVLCRRFDLRGVWRLTAVAVVGLTSVAYSAGELTPDLLLVAVLMSYLVVVTSETLCATWPRAAACGLLGALAYLTKSYGLPFFLAHFTVMIGLHAGVRQSCVTWRQAARTWILGMLGVGVLAGPWVAAISLRHGSVRFSDSGLAAHAIVAPGRSAPLWHPCDEGLTKPGAGRITVWEDPSTLQYAAWSPFESARALKHQARNVAAGLTTVAATVQHGDWFALRLASLAVLVVLICSARRNRSVSFLYCWVMATIVLGVGGYLPVYNLAGRYYWLCVIVLTVVCVHLLDRLGRALTSASDGRQSAGGVVGCLLAVAAVSLLAPAVWEIATQLRADPPGTAARRTTAVMRDSKCAGPIASTRYERGMHVAYHLQQPYLGMPAATSAGQLVSELREAGARTLIAWGDSPMAAQMASMSFLQRLAYVPAEDTVGLRCGVTVYRVTSN